MKKTAFSRFAIIALLSGLIVLSFQNCSPVAFNPIEADVLSASTEVPPNACRFNGQIYAEGQSVPAFASSSVPVGQMCLQETRICHQGSFTGSYPYATCSPGAQLACLFKDKTIPHGGFVDAFASSTVSYPSTCQPLRRVCNNGVLSGSADFETCTAQPAGSCSFDGKIIPHGTPVQAFAQLVASAGQTCQEETRFCNNGSLSGSFLYGTCTEQKTPVAGRCGASHGVSTGDAPTSNLCAAGNATSVNTNASNYTWSCSGLNGGSAINCSAPRVRYCEPAGAYYPSYDGKNVCTVTALTRTPVGQVINYGTGYTASMSSGSGDPRSIVQGNVSCVIGANGEPTYNWSSVVCPNVDAAVTSCPSYKITFPSPDGSNTCDVHVSNGAKAGSIVRSGDPGTTATNGANFQLSCHSNGAFSLDSYMCPNKAAATCLGHEISGIDAGAQGNLINSVAGGVSAISPRQVNFVNRCYVSIPQASAGQVFQQSAGMSDIPNRALQINVTCGSNGKWTGTWACP